MSQRRPAERGAIALLVVLAGAVVLGLAVAVLGAVADVQIAAARARTAADAAALAAVGTLPLVGGSGDICDEARRVAAANDANLRACRVGAHRGSDGVAGPAVEVEVTVEPRWAVVRSAVGPSPARAAAALQPRRSALSPAVGGRP